MISAPGLLIHFGGNQEVQDLDLRFPSSINQFNPTHEQKSGSWETGSGQSDPEESS